MFDMLNLMDFDTKKATFSAMTIVSLLLWLCVLSKWILFAFTGIFSLFALFLGYKLFFDGKLFKSKKNKVL